MIKKIQKYTSKIPTSTLILLSFLFLSISLNFYVLTDINYKTNEIKELIKEIENKEPIIIEKEIIKEIHTKKPIEKLDKNIKKSSVPSIPKSPKEDKIVKYILYSNKNISKNDAKYMAQCFIEAGKMFNINPYLLASIAKAESTYYRHSVSKSGAIGLMQVNWRVHEKNLKNKFPHIKCKEDLKEIRNGILSGAYVLKRLMQNTKDINRCLYGYLGQNSRSYVEKIHRYKNQIENI